MKHALPHHTTIEPVRYLRKPSSLYGYVYIEVSPDGSNIGFRENQPREDFSYCLDKSGLGRINKFKLEV